MKINNTYDLLNALTDVCNAKGAQTFLMLVSFMKRGSLM